jgi:hypothetical protein
MDTRQLRIKIHYDLFDIMPLNGIVSALCHPASQFTQKFTPRSEPSRPCRDGATHEHRYLPNVSNG